MDWKAVREIYDGTATAWTQLTRRGFNLSRDHFVAPAFLEMLPPVAGLSGLDLGCGEGYFTRLAAKQGATMTGIDLSSKMIEFCEEAESHEPLGIKYKTASAVETEFAASTFDFVISCQCLMDILELDEAFHEIYRVLKPGGFFQFSIKHPCFSTPRFDWIEDAQRRKIAVSCGDYFQTGSRVNKWTFLGVPEDLTQDVGYLSTPQQFRTLSTWFNSLIKSDFLLEEVAEPCPSAQLIEQYPVLEAFKAVAMFLFVRCIKSG